MSAYNEVLMQVPEADRGMVGLAANGLMNRTMGWRPSDAARAEVKRYNELGPVEYRLRFEAERGI